MTVIDPRGFENVQQWADFMTPMFEEFSDNFPRLDDPSEWQQWASTVFEVDVVEEKVLVHIVRQLTYDLHLGVATHC